VGSDQIFKKKNFRKANELARSRAKKSAYATVTIVCEDSKSSPAYFNELKKYFRLNTANIIVVPSKGSAPISVVDHAIEIAKNTDSIDRVACVIDHDNHESLKRAVNKLKTYKPKDDDKSKPIYQAIVSTPCFEIWLLLHLRYSTKMYISSGKKSAAQCLIDDLLTVLPAYKKNTIDWFDDLSDKINIAIKNAKKLQVYNKKTDSINPGTNMHELIEYLMKLKSGNNVTRYVVTMSP
jgi:hypothetical protein